MSKSELCKYCFGIEELETMDTFGNVLIRPCPACSGGLFTWKPAERANARKALEAAIAAVEGLGKTKVRRSA